MRKRKKSQQTQKYEVLRKRKKKEKEIESFEEQRKKVYKTLSPKTKIKRSKIWRLVHLIK